MGKPTNPVTRRELVKGAVTLAGAAAGSGLAGPAVAAASRRGHRSRRGPDRQRVAIIGAGAGGVAGAYFLSDRFDVDVFEARAKIGGHCDSHVLDYRGHRITVDLGAQFFHPDTHPMYVTLLEQVGLFDPAHPDGGETVVAPAGLCIFNGAGGPPVFSSSHPLATPARAIDFVTYARLARQAVLSNLPWETTVDAWIGGLAVDPAFKREVVYPWTTALIGCSHAEARRASARSILQTFALEFPADIALGATTYNSRIGLQGNLQRLLDRSPRVRLNLNAPALALTRQPAGWFVQTRNSCRGPYRSLVLNAPPLVTRRLLHPRREFAHVTALLHEYEYFDSRIVIHTDPAYVPRDRGDWATYNAEVAGPQCEGSVWYGGLRPKLASGQTLDVFKSWAQRRHVEPRHIRLERAFKHPHISRSTLQAAGALRPLQGHHGLYFSGQYTNGFDSQESAIYSAMKVAESLAPASSTLQELKSRLAARGLAGISYEL